VPWRGPEHPDDFPSLGWALLDWWAEYLPSPRDPLEPLLFTDEQALQLVEWFRIDPVEGRLVYDRGYSRRSKGWGKSPVEAAKAIAELAGPVRFAGWDADGEPVGMPWGLRGTERPWVQIGATSEDQTDNTWAVVHYLLTENDGKAADSLGIDAGLTRCYPRSMPGAKLEPVTAAAGSREGARPTYAVLDETHLWTPSNGGVNLAAVLRRGVAKTGGRSYETTNSFTIGGRSVAESSYDAVRKGTPGIFTDEVEAPREINGVQVNEKAPDDVLLAALAVAYGKSWWADTARLVRDMRDPSNKWEDSARFFLNWNQRSGEGWTVVSKADWSARQGAAQADIRGRAGLAVGRDQLTAALGFVGRREDVRLQYEVARQGAGTRWLVEACKAANADTGAAVLYDPKSPTAGVVADLEAAGVELEPVTHAQFVAACAAWQNEVAHDGMVHPGDAGLTDSVRLAEPRKVGEAWVVSARQSAGDICALEACLLASVGAREVVLVGAGPRRIR